MVSIQAIHSSTDGSVPTGGYNSWVREQAGDSESNTELPPHTPPPAKDPQRLTWLEKVRIATRAMTHRNYRLFIAGQFLSLIGTWIQAVAQSWLVYRLSGSA